jgi:Fur family transcriptional regulator, ferric uptake regulator
MTKARQAVLAILDATQEPLSAARIYALAGTCCDQATIYRALSYLEESGRAESFVLHCMEHGTERYFISKKIPHRHWFHCESCHKFIDLGICQIEELAAKIENAYDIEVRRHTLYFSGLCRKCKSRKA